MQSGGVENGTTSDNMKRQERVAGLKVRSATIQRRVSPTGPLCKVYFIITVKENSMKKLFLVALLCGAATTAQAQYGGGWGIYGPYGRPPRGAYDPPRPMPPPPSPYDRWGPQMEPCIYYGDCRGPRYPDLPRDRRY